MVTLGVYLMIRGANILNGISNIMIIIYFIGALSSLISALTGFSQFDIKKVIAFSTSSQIGYMITACGSQEYGIAMNHLINHAFFKAFLFINAGSIIHYIKDEQDYRNMGQIIKTNPWLNLAFILGTFSLIAMPYFSGFYSKDLVLDDLAHSWSVVLSGRIVYYLQLLTALITVIYSFRSYWSIFITSSSSNTYLIKESYLWPSIILSIPTIIGGYLISDLLVGAGTSYWDGNGIIKITENEVEEDELLVMTIILAILGGIIGYILTILNTPSKVLNLLQDRFNFDMIYNNILASWILREAKLNYALIDNGLINNYGYNTMMKIGRVIRYSNLDNGFVPINILIIVIIVLVLGILI